MSTKWAWIDSLQFTYLNNLCFFHCGKESFERILKQHFPKLEKEFIELISEEHLKNPEDRNSLWDSNKNKYISFSKKLEELYTKFGAKDIKIEENDTDYEPFKSWLSRIEEIEKTADSKAKLIQNQTVSNKLNNVVKNGDYKPVYWIVKNKKGLIINDKYLLIKPQNRSRNDLFADSLFNSNNEIVEISKDKWVSIVNKFNEENPKQQIKSFENMPEIVSDLGFVGTIKDLFISSDQQLVKFRKKVYVSDLDRDLIKTEIVDDSLNKLKPLS